MSFDTRIHLFANNATARLATAISVGDDEIVLRAGEGAAFPDPDYLEEIFIVTVENVQTGAREVMYCVDRTMDTLIVERAREGTAEQDFSASENVIVQARVTAGLLDYLANRGVPINQQTDDYTLVESDMGKCVEIDDSAPHDLTIPTHDDAPIPVFTTILVRQMGAGQITVVGDGGVTVRYPSTRSLTTTEQYSLVSLHKRAANEWCVAGDLEAS